MEAEERPIKKRRLSHDENTDAPDASKEDGETITRIGTADAGIKELNGLPLPMDEARNANLAGSNKNQGWDDVNGDNLSYKDTEEGLPPPSETAPLAESTSGNKDALPTSKNQQKKLRKKLEREAKRDEWKAIRKEKITAKRERKRAERKLAAENGNSPIVPPVKKTRKPVLLPVTILIDCDFDDLMLDKERISLAAQITRSYSDNKNAVFPAHLSICSFRGKLRERFDNILTHHKGWRGIRFLDYDFVEAAERAKEWMLEDEKGGKLAGAFSSLAAVDNDYENNRVTLKEQGEIVYLTSEADETLTELKPYSTYIIGGLVDKNREKGICYKRATKRGVKTARLPIGEFMDMQSRKVLATNHVNEIMLKWLECGDWGEAFMKVIPKRKGGKLKAHGDANDDAHDSGEKIANGHADGLTEEQGTGEAGQEFLEEPESMGGGGHDADSSELVS